MITVASSYLKLIVRNLGVIQGDGVDYESIPKILGALKDAGKSWGNLGLKKSAGMSQDHGQKSRDPNLMKDMKGVDRLKMVLFHWSPPWRSGRFCSGQHGLRQWWRFATKAEPASEHRKKIKKTSLAQPVESCVVSFGELMQQSQENFVSFVRNRDTFKCAFKCSEITVNGQAREVFKDDMVEPFPKIQSSKNSAGPHHRQGQGIQKRSLNRAKSRGNWRQRGGLWPDTSVKHTRATDPKHVMGFIRPNRWPFLMQDRYQPRQDENGIAGGQGFLHYSANGKFVTVASGQGDPSKVGFESSLTHCGPMGIIWNHDELWHIPNTVWINKYQISIWIIWNPWKHRLGVHRSIDFVELSRAVVLSPFTLAKRSYW